jgi:general secretion pathway protein L
LVVVQRQHDVELYFAARPGKFERVGTFSDGDLAGIFHRLGPVPAARTVLRIASDRAIRKVISLPPSALDFLSSIVRNKVESLSPWQSSDLLWGYRLVDTNPSTDSINIEIGMTGNDPVRSLVTDLKDAGIEVGCSEFGDNADPDAYISVQAASQSGSEHKSRSILVASIAGALLVMLAAAAGGMQAWRAQDDLSSTELQLQKLQAALDKQTAADGQETPVALAAALAARKQQDVPLIVVLKELTQKIPNGTWLQSVSYSDGRLVINGKGGAASQIVSLLEDSPLLQDVNFAAATQREMGDNQDSFSISATVSSAKGVQ